MAPELRARKRKASVPAAEAEVKKIKKTSVESEEKIKKTPADAEGAKKRKAVTEITAKPAKKSKAEVTAEPSISTSSPKAKSTPNKKQKSTKKTTKKSASKEAAPEENKDEELQGDASDNSDDDEEVDDQTAALLAGFDSEEEDPEPVGKEFEVGADVGKIDKKARKQALAAQKAAASDEPGTVYLGHLPHGFYEHEIKSYFTQFGEITRYRVSRNPKTGRSKHYAFVEFKSTEVADIVARTMDNYLLFGHILKCKLLAPGQAHPELWKGANKRFKTVPWNKIAGRKLKEGMDEAAWEKRNEIEKARRAKKAEKMKAIGYEFEAPDLKSAKDVPKTPREAPAAEETATNDETNEAAPVTDGKESDKISKKGKDLVSRAIETVRSEVLEISEEVPKVESTKEENPSKKVEEIVTVEETKIVEEVPKVDSTKVKKPSKKTEKIVTVEEIKIVEEPVAKESAPALVAEKSKKSKAAKKTEKTVVVEEVKIIEEPVAKESSSIPAAGKPKKSKAAKVVKETLEESVVVDTEVKEKRSRTLKSKKSSEKVLAEVVPKAKESKPAAKTKRSREDESAAETFPVGKAKKMKKQKSSSSLA